MIHHRFLEARDVMTSFCIFKGSTLVNQILLWPQIGKIEETDFFLREDRLAHCMGEIGKALKKGWRFFFFVMGSNVL